MHNHTRIPGFTADIIFERTTRMIDYVEEDRQLFDRQAVAPQKSEFVCGLALAAFLGGAATGNPFAVIGGLGGIISNC